MRYRIEQGADCWQILRRREVGKDAKKNAGKVVYEPVKYYATLEQAALGLLDMLTREKAASDDTAALIEAVQAAKADVIAVVKEVR